MRKEDVSSVNAAHAPWRIEKAWQEGSRANGAPSSPSNPQSLGTRGHFVTQARNTETGEVIYRGEGWSQASRAQAMRRVLEREAVAVWSQ